MPSNPPIDSTELARVEGMHGGNLYQHLYSVACMLLSQANEIEGIRIDFDEDIEIIRQNESYYIQVKTRNRNISPNDVDSSLQRFEKIDSLHQSGQRHGKALFFIAGNQPANSTLANIATTAKWKFLAPDDYSQLPPGLPPSWPDISNALTWCHDYAEKLPLRTLPTATLIWKLAAQVQAIAAGELSFGAEPHFIGRTHISHLLERSAHQLHSFPSLPPEYRSHADTISTNAKICLIVGLPGSGKTTWAAAMAQHTADITIYFDAAAVDSTFFQSALLRELIAQTDPIISVSTTREFRSAKSNHEAIHAVDMVLQKAAKRARVFVDNIHVASSEEITKVVVSNLSFKWILLSHPNSNVSALEGTLQISSQIFPPWSLSNIAAELRTHGATASPQDAQSVLALTGGLPMFVRGLALLASREFNGSTQGACQAIQERVLIEDLPQDAIISNSFDKFSKLSKIIISILIDIELPLSKTWLIDLVRKVENCEEAACAVALRELMRYGAIQRTSSDNLWAHSSYTGVARDWYLLQGELIDLARRRLIAIVEGFGLGNISVNQLSLLLRLLVKTKDFRKLSDMATEIPEQLQDSGLWKILEKSLNNVVLDDSFDNSSRFWSADTLTFWHTAEETWLLVPELLSRMKSFIDEKSSYRERVAFHHKSLIFSAHEKNADAVDTHYNSAIQAANGDAIAFRIISYAYASAQIKIRRFREAEREAARLVNTYYKIVGFTAQELLAKNPDFIAELIRERKSDTSEVKRLADSLYLYFLARHLRQTPSTHEIITAHKLYITVGFWAAAVRSGQEAADQFLTLTADPQMARGLLESLISIVEVKNLIEYMAPLHAHYAVILAYCGQFERARKTMIELAPFVGDLPEDQRKDILGQRELIERIAQGKVALRRQASAEDSIGTLLAGKKIERNAPCPCGSGLKYKKCHG